MISITIITLNEEKNIARVLNSLKGLADEVIVVDSGSDDKTVNISKKLGAKVFYRKFDNFSNQKNWAVSKAKGEWILSLDADEEVTPLLAEEIKKVIKRDKFTGYLIPRRNFILGREIKHSRWSPDKHIWLWRKDAGKWEGEVHEEVIVEGEVGELKSAKLHYQDESISSFIKSNNFYSSIYAAAQFKKGIRFSLSGLIFEPLFEFLIRFIYKLGFLDGKAGFTLSYLMAFYKISMWVKIYELQYLKK